MVFILPSNASQALYLEDTILNFRLKLSYRSISCADRPGNTLARKISSVDKAGTPTGQSLTHTITVQDATLGLHATALWHATRANWTWGACCPCKQLSLMTTWCALAPCRVPKVANLCSSDHRQWGQQPGRQPLLCLPGVTGAEGWWNAHQDQW